MAESEAALVNDVQTPSGYDPSYDPTFGNGGLPLRAVCYPMGFPAEIFTNSPEIIAAVEESFGQFRQMYNEPPVQIRIAVTDGQSDGRALPQYRTGDNLLTLIVDKENFMACDLSRGTGFGWLSQSVVAERAHFRYHWLEGAIWSLLQAQHMTPIHAACVRTSDRGILLCGDSGAGKSSLAFACARAGWTFVSDDSTRLVRKSADRRVVGNPYRMRFREAAIELFPELANQDLTPRITGELAIELATATIPEIKIAQSSSVDYILFLNRQEPYPPSLTPLSRESTAPWFEQMICYGTNELRESQLASLRWLLEVPVYELRYSDLDWAVDRLETLVRTGS